MSNSMAGTGWWRPQASPSVPIDASPRSSGASVLRLPFWALIAFTLIMILAPQDFFPALKPLHLAFVTAALTGATYLFSRFTGTAGEIHRSPAVAIAVMLFLWAVALVPFSLWPGGSFAKIFDMFVKALLIFWLLARVVNSVPRLRTVALTLSLISIPLSFSAISAFAKVGVGNIDYTHGLDRIVGYQGGLTANPNNLALMINLTLPFTVALMLSTRKLSARVVFAGIAVLDVIAVGATYSRGGFLTLMTIIAAYLWCLPGRTRRVLLVAIVALGLVAIPLIPTGYWTRLGTITDIQADNTNSAQERWADMVTAVHIIVDHPVIGVGAGMDILALNRARDDNYGRHVHNIYLEYGVDLGLPGMVLFLLLYYQVFKSVKAARRIARENSGDDTFYWLSESLWIVLIAFAVSSFFHPIAYQFYFYYIAGLAVAVGAIAAARTAPHQLRGKPVKA